VHIEPDWDLAAQPAPDFEVDRQVNWWWPIKGAILALRRLKCLSVEVPTDTNSSYLLFESGCTSELMALGYADAEKQRAEACAFLGWLDPIHSEGDTIAAEKQRTDRRVDPLRLR
jgi:hypothetical protein